MLHITLLRIRRRNHSASPRCGPGQNCPVYLTFLRLLSLVSPGRTSTRTGVVMSLRFSCGGVRATRGLPSLRPSHRIAEWETGFSYGGFFENGQLVSGGDSLSESAFMRITTGAPDETRRLSGGSSIATLLAITAVRFQRSYPFRWLSCFVSRGLLTRATSRVKNIHR